MYNKNAATFKGLMAKLYTEIFILKPKQGVHKVSIILKCNTMATHYIY